MGFGKYIVLGRLCLTVSDSVGQMLRRSPCWRGGRKGQWSPRSNLVDDWGIGTTTNQWTKAQVTVAGQGQAREVFLVDFLTLEKWVGALEKHHFTNELQNCGVTIQPRPRNDGMQQTGSGMGLRRVLQEGHPKMDIFGSAWLGHCGVSGEDQARFKAGTRPRHPFRFWWFLGVFLGQW